jgi:cellulose synthase/poly-beta-1,6-N-acetylglucosamine synthase-like glycosyltransferase
VAAALLLPATVFLVPALWGLGRIGAVLRGRARLPRATEAPAARESRLVSVLVPARNEERGVAACLASLSAQTCPKLEIVAVVAQAILVTVQPPGTFVEEIVLAPTPGGL